MIRHVITRRYSQVLQMAHRALSTYESKAPDSGVARHWQPVPGHEWHHSQLHAWQRRKKHMQWRWDGVKDIHLSSKAGSDRKAKEGPLHGHRWWAPAVLPACLSNQLHKQPNVGEICDVVLCIYSRRKPHCRGELRYCMPNCLVVFACSACKCSCFVEIKRRETHRNNSKHCSG